LAASNDTAVRPEVDILKEKYAVADEMGLIVRLSGVGQIGIAEQYRDRYETLRARHEALERELFASYEKPRLEERERLQRERNEKMWADRDARVKALPVKERKNGWEIVNDGGTYHVRDPHTGESVYSGKLHRCRQVAAESPPDPPQPLPTEAN
jgi:hypothetical protein